MANLSEHTRKEQVHNYLRVRLNQWVDGPNLANEQVGGSEGLKRLRELRAELSGSSYDIEMRSHPEPDRDIFQYRMTQRAIPQPAHTDPVPAPPMQAANGVTAERSPTRLNAPERRDITYRGAKGRVEYDPETDTYVAVYDGPPAGIEETPDPLPGQTDMGVETQDGLKYATKPERLDFGKSRPCPKCHGIHRAINEYEPDPTNPKKQRAVKVFNGATGKLVNKTIGYEDWTRNPSKPSEECPRCNGFGLIPA